MIERNVKIFISSTFKDMHTERDYLINYVFPGIKRKALNLGIHLLDIDLRWGITEEEALNGKTIEICLDEVENARPFFIGLLGDRYGWIPESLQESTKKYLGTKELPVTNCSITHMEILYGVLTAKNMNERSFFFVRNVSKNNQLPEYIRQMFMDEDKKNKTLQDSLKSDIKNYYYDLADNHIFTYDTDFYGIKFNHEQVTSILPSVFNEFEIAIISKYLNEDLVISKDDFHLISIEIIQKLSKIGVAYFINLERFGEVVSKVIYDSLEKEYGLKAKNTEQKHEELKVHRAFLRDRIHNFTGRYEIVEEIAHSARKHPITFIEGSVGSGKSSLIGKVASNLETKYSSYIVFCGLSEASSTIKGVINILIDQLSDQLSIKLNKRSNTSYKDDIELFFNLLMTIDPNEEIYIFIDALDQLVPINSPELFEWLPKDLFKIHFVCSTNKGIYTEQAKRLQFPIISVTPLTIKESEEIIHNYLNEYRKSLSQYQLDIFLEKQAINNPLYLTTAIDLIRTFPKYEELNQLLFHLPTDVEGIFSFFIDELLIHHPSSFVKDILSWLFLARFGIMEADLLMLYELKYQKHCPRLIWVRLYQRLAFYLTNLSENKQGLITPFHQVFSKAIELKFLNNPEFKIEQTKYLALLAKKQFDANEKYVSNLAQFLGSYLFEANDMQTLTQVISKLSTFSEFKPQHIIIEHLMTDCALSKDKDIYQKLDLVLLKLQSCSNIYNLIFILLSEVERIQLRGLTSFSYYLTRHVINYIENYKGKDEALIRLITLIEMGQVCLSIAGLEKEAINYFLKAKDSFEDLNYISKLYFGYSNTATLFKHLSYIHFENNQIDLANQYLEKTDYYNEKSFMFRHIKKINTSTYFSIKEYVLSASHVENYQKKILRTVSKIKKALKKNQNDLDLFLIYLSLEQKVIKKNQNILDDIARYQTLYDRAQHFLSKDPYNQKIKINIIDLLKVLIFNLLKSDLDDDAKMYLEELDDQTLALIKLDDYNKSFKLARCDFYKLLGDYYKKVWKYGQILETLEKSFYIWFDTYQYHFITKDIAQLILIYGRNYLIALNQKDKYEEVVSLSDKIFRKAQEVECDLLLLSDIHYQKAVACFRLQEIQVYYDSMVYVVNHYENFLHNDPSNNVAIDKYLQYLSTFISLSIEQKEFSLIFELFYKQLCTRYNDQTRSIYLHSIEDSLNQIKIEWLRNLLLECNPKEMTYFIKKILRFINFRLERIDKTVLEKVLYILATLFDINQDEILNEVENNYIQANLLRLKSILMQLNQSPSREFEEHLITSLSLYVSIIKTDKDPQLKEELFSVYDSLAKISDKNQSIQYQNIMKNVAKELSEIHYASSYVESWLTSNKI